MTSANWITAAEGALAGTPQPEVEVVAAHPPPLLDAQGSRLLATPLMAAIMWAAVRLQYDMAGGGLGPILLLLKLLALALSVRTLRVVWELFKRARLRARSADYGLALTAEGLLYRSPQGDVAVPKADILAVRERDALGPRQDPTSPVFVITQPDTGRTHLALPPVLDHNPRALAERLMRWLGAPVSTTAPETAEQEATPAASTHTASNAAELPSRIYEAAAKGEAPANVIALRLGRRWLRRGPYFTVLLGLVIADGFFRLAPTTRNAVGPIAPMVVVFSLLVVPLLWAVLVRIDIAPRKGLSLVLTPTMAIMRTRAGAHVVTWRKLKKAAVTQRRAWSLLRGPYENRALRLERTDAEEIAYEESFLGEPAEVVAGLCEAYRRGQVRA